MSSLFGNSAKRPFSLNQGQQTQQQPAQQPQSQFGLNTNPLINQQPASQQPNQSQPLTTTVDQAGFVLNGVKPSDTLYTSLSVPAVKHSRDGAIYDLPSRPLNTKSRIASTRHVPVQTPVRTEISVGKNEPHHYINSYDEFLVEKPTILTIKKSGQHVPQSIERLVKELHSSNLEVPVAKSTMKPQQTAVKVSINEQALAEGYYSTPTLRELAAMSTNELSAVRNLSIGREGFGKLEYHCPIDLSKLDDLGDLLGNLVVFNGGTVCVYPHESSKKSPGHELNMPCTVTIMDAWPRTPDHEKIRDMQDPRMRKHIDRLRKVSEQEGGEFITFTNYGEWVFKVPHFSTWGLPISEMVVDESEEEDEDEDIVVDYFDNDFDDADVLGAEEEAEEQALEVKAEDLEMEVEDNILDEVPSDEEPKFMNWREKLSLTGGSFFKSEIPISNLEKSTNSVLLSELIVPPTNEVVEDFGMDFDENDIVPQSELELLEFSNLRDYFAKSERAKSDLPLFSTKVTFQDLKKFSPGNSNLWDLLSVLYENDADFNMISSWIDKQIPANTDSAKTDLDEIFDNVSRHNLKRAKELSLKPQLQHLSLLISMLGDKEHIDTLNKNAANQITEWRMSNTLDTIEPAVRHIWELAAGVQPSISPLKLTWPQWLGMRVWYSSQSSLKSAIKSLPEILLNNDIALKFLQAYAGVLDFKAALAKLDIVECFLCLQALENSKSPTVSSSFSDEIYKNLAFILNNAQLPVTAVYASLHINDTGLASKTLDKILLSGAVKSPLPSVFGVPDQVLESARAYQVEKSGDYMSQAEHLIRAKRYQDAHEVIISNVGPHAVIYKKTNEIIDLLTCLEEKSNEITNWERGGNVYLSYIRAEMLASERELAALCFDCRRCLTPTNISKRAVGIISEWVANMVPSTTSASKGTPIEDVVKMQFDPNQKMIQLLQQSARLLA